MYSNYYHYINIYKDKALSESVSTKELVEFLQTIPELKQENEFTFSNRENSSFINFTLLNAKSIDSYTNTISETTNMIAIVCSKQDEDLEKSLKIGIKIAQFLNWKIEEEPE